MPVERITAAIREVFDLRPAAIIRDLDLLRPIYAATAAYGHFGRELEQFTWERTDRAGPGRACHTWDCRSATRSVRSHVNCSSSRPKCPYAADAA